MKKLILLFSVLLIAMSMSGQTLQKGNLVGMHLIKLTVQPDATYNQWKDLTLKKWIPKMEELFQGDLKLFLAEGIRGENKNEIAFIYVFKSEAARNKYYNNDGGNTELGKQIQEKISVLNKEFEKIEKSFSTPTFTDWIVQ